MVLQNVLQLLFLCHSLQHLDAALATIAPTSTSKKSKVLLPERNFIGWYLRIATIKFVFVLPRVFCWLDTIFWPLLQTLCGDQELDQCEAALPDLRPRVGRLGRQTREVGGGGEGGAGLHPRPGHQRLPGRAPLRQRGLGRGHGRRGRGFS